MVEAIATSAIDWVVEEYKNSKAFEIDIAEARVGAYAIGFDDCKAKVDWNHPRLDLSNIIANGALLEEEGRDEERTRNA